MRTLVSNVCFPFIDLTKHKSLFPLILLGYSIKHAKKYEYKGKQAKVYGYGPHFIYSRSYKMKGNIHEY